MRLFPVWRSRMAPGGQSGGLTEADRGKKRMREYGSVSIPQEAFIAALRMGEEQAAERMGARRSRRELTSERRVHSGWRGGEPQASRARSTSRIHFVTTL
jgi:hypothetical protein